MELPYFYFIVTSLANHFLPLQASHAALLGRFAPSGFALCARILSRFALLGFVLRTRFLSCFAPFGFALASSVASLLRALRFVHAIRASRSQKFLKKISVSQLTQNALKHIKMQTRSIQRTQTPPRL